MKTRKNENSWKVREQPFAGEFSEMGGGGRVSSCRPLSGKSALVGNESRFCRSKRPRHRLKCLENAFPAINFSKFSGGGPPDPHPWSVRGLQPSLVGHVHAPKTDFTPYACWPHLVLETAVESSEVAELLLNTATRRRCRHARHSLVQTRTAACV